MWSQCDGAVGVIDAWGSSAAGNLGYKPLFELVIIIFWWIFVSDLTKTRSPHSWISACCWWRFTWNRAGRLCHCRALGSLILHPSGAQPSGMDARVVRDSVLPLQSFLWGCLFKNLLKHCFVGTNLVKIRSHNLLNPLKWLHLNCKPEENRQMRQLSRWPAPGPGWCIPWASCTASGRSPAGT